MRAPMIGLCLVAAIASPAQADEKADKARAKQLYDEGLKHYNLSEWTEAIKSWKEAYSLSRRPLLLFNIGQAYRLSGDCKQAMNFYDSYQREEPSPKNQDELDDALKLCKDAKPDKPAIVDKPVITEPPPDPVKPVATPVQPVTTQSDEPEGGGGMLRKVGMGVGAAGVVLGAVGVYFALDSKSASSDLDNFTGEWTQTQIDLEAQGKSSATKAWIFGLGGVAAIGVGAALYVVGGPKATETSTVTIVPTRGGAAFGWSTRF